jgi:UDP-N-acetylglucosamine--N-acetylmuramyl-(pentapeptide) pyrophosphoryl-undecaprenol N-acetylglucosamine transferase
MPEAPELRILIAGGGTGGHLFPALAIGAGILEKHPESRIHYVGTRFGIDAQVFQAQGVSYTLMPIRGIQRGISLTALGRNLLLPGRFFHSQYLTRKLIQSFQPRVVVGTGGYASYLPLKTAIKAGIPTLIQEQNSYPGFVTRLLEDRVERVCIAFEEARQHLKKKLQSSPATRCGRESVKGIG